MMASVAPHMGEEIWQMLGKEKTLFENPVWYEADQEALSVDSVTVMVQINGKIRGKIELPVDSEEQEVKEAAMLDDKVKSYVEGKTIVKEIYVKNKIYNIVVK